MSKTEIRFSVSSGKYEEYDGKMERNTKYVNQFATFQEAFVEWKINRDYPFNGIYLHDDDGVIYDVTPQIYFKEDTTSYEVIFGEQ